MQRLFFFLARRWEQKKTNTVDDPLLKTLGLLFRIISLLPVGDSVESFLVQVEAERRLDKDRYSVLSIDRMAVCDSEKRVMAKV